MMLPVKHAQTTVRKHHAVEDGLLVCPQINLVTVRVEEKTLVVDAIKKRAMSRKFHLCKFYISPLQKNRFYNFFVIEYIFMKDFKTCACN